MNAKAAIASPAVAEVVARLGEPCGEVLAEALGALSEEFPGSVRADVLHVAWHTLRASYPGGAGLVRVRGGRHGVPAVV